MNEKLLFDEYLRICELTIDSMIKMDRHKHVFGHYEDETVSVSFRYLESPWLVNRENDHRHCYRRSRYSQRESSLFEAWGKEVNSLGEILATIQCDLLLLVKKRAQERAFKVSLRNDSTRT